MCVCVYVGWVGVGGLALNVDCTGIFIVYMYAHLYVFTSILCVSFTIHSRFTLCDLLFILVSLWYLN